MIPSNMSDKNVKIILSPCMSHIGRTRGWYYVYSYVIFFVFSLHYVYRVIYAYDM